MTTAADNITQVAYQAGFRGQALVTAVALALAESGGNPNSLNNNPGTGDYSVGYWQINYYGPLASRSKTLGPPDSLRGTNPTGPEAQANARAAYSLSGGGKNWQPWQADFNNGHYYANYNDAYHSVQQYMGGNIAPGATGSPGSTATQGTDYVATPPAEDKCLINVPVVGCLLKESQARALFGIVCIGTGIAVGGLGLVLLVTGSTKLTGVVGKMNPETGAIAAVAASQKDKKLNKEIDRGSKPTAEQQRQARGRYREKVVKDADGNAF